MPTCEIQWLFCKISYPLLKFSKPCSCLVFTLIYASYMYLWATTKLWICVSHLFNSKKGFLPISISPFGFWLFVIGIISFMHLYDNKVSICMLIEQFWYIYLISCWIWKKINWSHSWESANSNQWGLRCIFVATTLISFSPFFCCTSCGIVECMIVRIAIIKVFINKKGRFVDFLFWVSDYFIFILV